MFPGNPKHKNDSSADGAQDEAPGRAGDTVTSGDAGDTAIALGINPPVTGIVHHRRRFNHGGYLGFVFNYVMI